MWRKGVGEKNMNGPCKPPGSLQVLPRITRWLAGLFKLCLDCRWVKLSTRGEHQNSSGFWMFMMFISLKAYMGKSSNIIGFWWLWAVSEFPTLWPHTSIGPELGSFAQVAESASAGLQGSRPWVPWLVPSYCWIAISFRKVLGAGWSLLGVSTYNWHMI